MELLVPPLSLPGPALLRDDVSGTQTRLSEWARRTGLVSDGPAGERFDRALVGSVACSAYPYAPDGVIDLVADWLGWYYVFDDVLDGTPEGLDVVYVATVVDALSSVFENVVRRHPTPVVEACRVALTDLWQRSSMVTPTSWQERFAEDFVGYLGAHMAQAEINASGVPPAKNAFLPLRLDAGAMWTCIDLIEVTTGYLDPNLFTHPDLQTVRRSVANITAWANDLWSAPKELARGELCNFVIVVEDQFGVGLQEAACIVAGEIEAQTGLASASAARIRRELLPHLTADRRAAFELLLDGLLAWPAGNVAWSARSDRYRDRSVSCSPVENTRE